LRAGMGAPKDVRKARYEMLKDRLYKVSEDHPLSIRPMRQLYYIENPDVSPQKKSTPVSAKAKVDYLNNLASSVSPESAQLWGDTILRAGSKSFTHSQFELDQAKTLSRREAINYGSLIIGRSQVLKVMNSYGEILRNEIMPIYKDLYTVTRKINEFFMEGELGAADEAAAAGEELADETKTLALDVKGT